LVRPDNRCSEAAKLDRFWLEFSAADSRLGGAESDEGIEVFGRPEGVYEANELLFIYSIIGR
jgi:hypothetical protein